MKILRYKELISETLINPFDHPYVIINKEMEILGFHGCQDNLIFSTAPYEGGYLPDMLNPEIKEAFNENYHQAINGSTTPSQFNAIGSDALARIQVVTAPFEVEDNRFICFFETIQRTETQNTSPENQSLNGFSKTEGIFYKAFHFAPIPLAIAKMQDCTLLEVNEALIMKSGYSREQLIGTCALKLGFWKNEADPRKITELLGANKCVHNYEVSFTQPNGKEIHALLNLDLVEINGEQCVLAIIQDLTNIKRTEAKLKENEHLLISINENLNEGIYRSTPEDGFIYLNKAFARMFGLSVEEALQTNPENFYANDKDRTRIKQILATEGCLKNEQVEFRKQNGETFWGILSGITTQDDDGNYIYDGAIVDISEIRNSKVLLREKNEELKKINSELDRFVYSASHDLRAPLTSLLGLVNIALLETKSEKVINYLEMMKGSVSKLDGLISDIINFSRNTRLGVNPEVIDFRHLIQDAFEHLKYMATAESITTEMHIEDHKSFYSDPKRLVILINNLIANAFRYHDLSKNNPYIKVAVRFQDNLATIKVIDNGKGIDPEHIDSIFEMFFRATTESKGSGLGLYIAKETAEKLQGTISVESELDKGSTFTISIPNLREHF